MAAAAHLALGGNILLPVTSPPRSADRFRKLQTAGPRRWLERRLRFPVTIERACTTAPVPLLDPA
jgi:hypothetical protein